MVERYRPSPKPAAGRRRGKTWMNGDEDRILQELKMMDQLRHELRQSEQILNRIVSDARDPVRAEYESFRRSGGVTARDWRAWLRGDIGEDRVTERNGLRVVVSNWVGNHPAQGRRRQSG